MGLAISFVFGAFPVLVVHFSAMVLLLSLVSGARQDPYRRMMAYPLVIVLSLVLLVNFGPITWPITGAGGLCLPRSNSWARPSGGEAGTGCSARSSDGSAGRFG